MMLAIGNLARAQSVAAVRRATAVRTLATVGDKVPDVVLHKGFPPEKVNLREHCKGKSVIL